MRVLNLTLKKHWFDLILSGDKTFEYREYKDHWIKRLLDKGTKSFDEIHFINGYGKHRPWMKTDFIGMGVMDGKNISPSNEEPIDKNKMYFVIAIGNILDFGNLKDIGVENE